jgi:hypothetical protein
VILISQWDEGIICLRSWMTARVDGCLFHGHNSDPVELNVPTVS